MPKKQKQTDSRAAALLWWAYHPHLSASTAAARLSVSASALRRGRASAAWKQARALAEAGAALPEGLPPIETPPAPSGARRRPRKGVGLGGGKKTSPEGAGGAGGHSAPPSAPDSDPLLGNPDRLRGVLRRAALVDLEALQTTTAPKARLIHAQTLKTILQIDPSLWKANTTEIDTRRSDRHDRLLRSLRGAPSLTVIEGRAEAGGSD